MNGVSIRHSAKDLLKCLMLGMYKGALRLGVHIVPDHYYVSLPNLYELKKTKQTWARRSELPGVQSNLDEFEERLRRICEPYKAEYTGLPQWGVAMSCGAGPGYGYIESQCLHSIIRAYQPQRIVEIGSGVSTSVMLAALRRNSGAHHMTCIEPYPSRWLTEREDITLLRRPVQAVGLEAFEHLGENDVLFMDSSHTVKPGSDVNYLILEVLPRLKPGVLVHCHDIYFPYDYSRDVLDSFLHWSETSLLHAFLVHNTRAKLLLSLSMLHYDRPEALRDVFPEYNREPDCDGMRTGVAKAMKTNMTQHFPSSTWISIQ